MPDLEGISQVYPHPWPRLPAAEMEGRTVERMFASSRLLVGANATENNVMNAIKDYNVLHFATHGMLPSDVLNSQFASLVLTPSDTTDGYLSATELAMKDMSHVQLVVLSACETSVTLEGRPDSLASAFIKAGSSRVIGTQWQVSDEATALLMLNFYRKYVSKGAAESLRIAQNEFISSAKYNHPFYWSAFVFFGVSR